MNETKQWRPFPGYENSYLISNKGEVYSIRSKRCLKLKVLPSGYLRVSPCANGKRSECAVHRMVALAFIPNPENKPTVNHINENKKDNRVENLEWATNAEQNIHGTRIARVVKHTNYHTRKIDYKAGALKHHYKTMNAAQMKPVIQLDRQGNFVARHRSLSTAAKYAGISVSHLCTCLKKGRFPKGEYQWKYE